jgi:predicted nicotinamide N-methyase
MAAQLGGTVVATDRNEASLALTAENAQMNGVEVETFKYAFGDDVPEEIGNADVVLLADVCYNADAPALLRKTLRCLKAGGYALGVFKIRSTEVRGVVKAFLDGMRQDGFDVTPVALAPDAATVYDANGDALPAHGFPGVQGWTFRRSA